jgi:hypothetical protein
MSAVEPPHRHHLGEDLTARCVCGLLGYTEWPWRDRAAERAEAREAGRAERRRQWSLRTTEERMIDSANRARRYRTYGRRVTK